MSTLFLEMATAHEGAEQSVGNLAALVRAEYDEMPGLALTRPQLCRMFAVDQPTCDTVVRDLVEAGVLVRRPNGSYATRRALMLNWGDGDEVVKPSCSRATTGSP